MYTWMDVAMEYIREKSDSSQFLKRLIFRIKKFHGMFGFGLGHAEYTQLAILEYSVSWLTLSDGKLDIVKKSDYKGIFNQYQRK